MQMSTREKLDKVKELNYACSELNIFFGNTPHVLAFTPVYDKDMYGKDDLASGIYADNKLEDWITEYYKEIEGPCFNTDLVTLTKECKTIIPALNDGVYSCILATSRYDKLPCYLMIKRLQMCTSPTMYVPVMTGLLRLADDIDEQLVYSFFK